MSDDSDRRIRDLFEALSLSVAAIEKLQFEVRSQKIELDRLTAELGIADGFKAILRRALRR